MTISEGQAARARYIRTLLAWHDLTQSDLARILGISQPAANRKLKGKRRFEDDELLAIAEAFDVDPANMLRPPQLAHVMGAVPDSGRGLLTCTKYQAPQVRAKGRPQCGIAANDTLYGSLAAA